MRNRLTWSWKQFIQRKVILRNMRILSLLAVVIPVLAVGLGSYSFSSSAIKTEVNQSNIRILNNMSSTLDATLDRIQNNAIQMLWGSFFRSNLVELKSQNYSGFYSSIIQNVSALQGANKEVADIAMYINDEAYNISSSSGNRKVTDVNEKEEFSKALSSSDQIKWVSGTFPFEQSANQNGVTFISKVPLYTNNPIGLLMIRIDESLFRDIMKRFVGYSGEQMFILDEKGELISSVTGADVPEGLFEKTTQLEDSGQRFAFSWNEVDYMATSSISDYNKWRYIDMVPVRQLNAKSNGIALITLGIALFCLVLGLIVVFWGSRRVYRPIENLVADMKEGQVLDAVTDELGFVRKRWGELSSTANQLQQQISDQLPIIREIFALQLLQGHYLHYSEDQMNLMLDRYDVPLGRENSIFVISCDSQPDAVSPFQERDRDLIVFAMKNITGDLLGSLQQDFIVINLLNDQVAVWLLRDAMQNDEEQLSVKSVAEKLRLLVSNYLRLPVSIGLSGQSDRIADLPELFQEANLAVRSRIVVGGNQVIAYTGGGSESDLHYRYPLEIETHIENSLQIGDRDEARRMLDEFTKSMQDAVHKPELIQMSYYRLLTAVIRTAYLLGMDSSRLFGEEAADPYTNVRQSSTISELNEWFKEQLVEQIVAYVHGKQHQEHEQLIQKVVRYIEENYHFDLSLEQCAQICGLSPQYLSKIFKKTMDVSFIEYLTKYRIERAIELLRTTDLSVTDVAERVGYQFKNFIRVFKKHVGVTPGQFRGSENEE